MFVAIRHNWSSSYGDWEIQPREYSSLAEAKEVLCHGMLECSEHCRGMEVKCVPVARLPKKWLEEQIEEHLHNAKYYTAMAAKLRKLLERKTK